VRRAAAVVGAVAVTALVAAFPLLDPGPLVPLVQALAALAVAAAVIGSVGLPAWGAVTAVLLGAEFVTTLHGRTSAVDLRAPLLAGALLVVAELVTWAAELRTAGREVPGAVPRSVVIAGSGVAGGAAAMVLAAVAGVPIGHDLALPASGAAAIAAVTGLVLALARRPLSRRDAR
jgi:hypothetical protein